MTTLKEMEEAKLMVKTSLSKIVLFLKARPSLSKIVLFLGLKQTEFSGSAKNRSDSDNGSYLSAVKKLIVTISTFPDLRKMRPTERY